MRVQCRNCLLYDGKRCTKRKIALRGGKSRNCPMFIARFVKKKEVRQAIRAMPKEAKEKIVQATVPPQALPKPADVTKAQSAIDTERKILEEQKKERKKEGIWGSVKNMFKGRKKT